MNKFWGVAGRRWWRGLTSCTALCLCGGYALHAAAESATFVTQVPIVVHVNPLVARRIGNPAVHVRNIAVDHQSVWVSTRGGGLYAIEGHRIRHFDIGHGLPTGLVWQAERTRDGRLAVATELGLVWLDERRVERQRLAAISTSNRASSAANLLAISPRDGSLLVQFSSEQVIGERGGGSRLWRVVGTRITPWPPTKDRSVEATATFLDVTTGCLHVAGVELRAPGNTLWGVRECRAGSGVWTFEPVLPELALGVAALARDPRSGRLVVVAVRQRGQDPRTRRYTVMEATDEGTVVPHCSHAEFEEEVTGMIAEPVGQRLLVALYGAGLRTLDCEGSHPRRPENADARLKFATALASDSRGQIWLGTTKGLFVLRTWDGTPRPILTPGQNTLATDSLPTDIRPAPLRVLLSSARDGVVELVRGETGWRPGRRWRAGAPLPQAVYGPATYGPQGQILVALRSRGIARLHDARSEVIGLKEGLALSHVMQLGAVGEEGFWVAMGASPLDTKGAALQWVRADGFVTQTPIRSSALQPNGSLLTWPDGRVWVPTRVGVVQADANGRLQRLSRYGVQTVFRNAKTGAIAAVGTTVERWSEGTFVPVLFRVPEESLNNTSLGHPVDVVIDNHGRWVILYSSGRLVLLDSMRRFVTILGPADGIPTGACKLLYVDASDEILLGTRQEGIFVLTYR